MTKKEKDDLFAARLPGVLQYHQLMLSDGVRNKLLYEAIKSCVTEETNFLDVGAGTGVWAILAAKLGAKRVVAVEIEECLIPIIYKHAQENGVADKIEIIHANIDDVKIRGKFDVIVSEVFGGDAFGEATINSFIKLRNKYLAPNGKLIPQSLTMFAVPSKVQKPISDVPVELDISSNFLKSLKFNYARNMSLSERNEIKFLDQPRELLSVDFRTIQKPPSLQNLNAIWEVKNTGEANAFAVFNQSIFADNIIMDSFGSQSWNTVIYEFQPFPKDEKGEMRFSITLGSDNNSWSVSLPSNVEAKSQNFSPVFSFTRATLAHKATPHRKFKTSNNV